MTVLVKTLHVHVTRFTKKVLCMHNFKSHFSQPCDEYNNRLTVHVYIIAKCLLLLMPHS